MRMRTGLAHMPRPSLRRFSLRFSDPRVDEAFQDADNHAAVGRARFYALFALGLSMPFLYVDLLISTEKFGRLIAMRAIASASLVLIAVLATWWSSAHRHIQLIACGGIALYAWCTVVSVPVANVPRDYPRVGTVLLILGLVGVVRVRFEPALVTTMLTIPPVEYILVIKRGSWDDLLFETLSLVAFAILIVTIAYVLERSKRTQFLTNSDLESERQLSDELLHSILPESIAARLRENPGAIADSAAEATVLFADIVGFTPFSFTMEPTEIVELLDLLFGKFDDLCEKHGIEKIKTIGDAYMAVAGIPRPDPDHAASVVELALDMQRVATTIAPLWPTELALRIGISSGPVVAGVIGHHKFAYDLWGDTVNTASRMEMHGEPNRIHVSESTHEFLRDRYTFGEPRETNIKGMGPMTTYYLLGPDQY